MTLPDPTGRLVAEPTSIAMVPSTDPRPLELAFAAPTRRPRPSVRKWAIASGLIAVVAAGAWGVARWKPWRGEDPIKLLPKYSVARADLSSVLTSWGRVESSKNTVIACELERLDMGSRGISITTSGASTVLWVIPEGSEVKKGDVLCSLDSSEYEEIVRTQEIKTEQAAAALQQAQLNLEVAQIAVKEYLEGLHQQTLKSLEGSISLAESDRERAQDRLRWTEAMIKKGYTSIAQKMNDRRTLAQALSDLDAYQFELKNYNKFGSTRTRVDLESEVEKRRFEVAANSQRVARSRERLAHYKHMVDCCTIRAPHDGFVIYSTESFRPGMPPLEAGSTVRQQQKLFELPDLGTMQVLAYMHESVARKVHEGMTARARIEGLGNRALEGHVVSVAQLPTNAGNWFSDEVKYFLGVVKLDAAPKGLRPGMTAEVEVDIDRRNDVLAVPAEAVAFEQGRGVCYVAGPDGLERRPVSLGRSTKALLEVTQGLAEGDQVVLRPDQVEAIDSLVVDADHGSEIAEGPGTGEGPTGAGNVE